MGRLDTNKKKLLTLIVFCVIWALIIAYNLGAFKGSDSAQARPAEQRTQEGKSGQAASADALPALRDDLLERPKHRYSAVVRDIFTPFKVEVKALPVVQPTPSASVVKLPTPLETFAAQIKFIGSLEKGGTTVFVGSGSDIFMVKKGDLMTDKFKVAEITGTTIKLRDVGSDETVTIELQKK